jgi:hypothetical protein
MVMLQESRPVMALFGRGRVVNKGNYHEDSGTLTYTEAIAVSVEPAK